MVGARILRVAVRQARGGDNENVDEEPVHGLFSSLRFPRSPRLSRRGRYVFDIAAAVSELLVTEDGSPASRQRISAAPVEVVGGPALKRVGQPDLIQALTQNLPSFNSEAFGTDTGQLTLSAQLRGLNPNNTLVLIDGKRRHSTGNLHVAPGVFQGAATPDLGLIPVAAIDHIEVLQDGAAAAVVRRWSSRSPGW